MPKSKSYYCYEIPTSVVKIVVTVCADYDRRENAIKYSNVTGDVLDTYVNLNNTINAALEEIEIGIREPLLRDIGKRCGYDTSQACFCISRGAYYRRKRKLIHDIAIGLNLIP